MRAAFLLADKLDGGAGRALNYLRPLTATTKRVYLALGLKKAAAEQAGLIETPNAERDRHQSMANTFAEEMLIPNEASPGPK